MREFKNQQNLFNINKKKINWGGGRRELEGPVGLS